MNIAQISDLHLGQKKRPDVDVGANLLKVLDDIAGQGVDLIVVSGDLVQEEDDEESCVALRERLDACGPPWRVTPGNHDDRQLLTRVFGLPLQPSGEIYSHEARGGVDLFFLDSSQSVFSAVQWAWLAKRVRPSRAPFLFVHHPPVAAGVPAMDRDWPFLEDAEFRSRLLSMKKAMTVFCGHYHTEKTVRLPNLDLYLCPAVNWQYEASDPEIRVGSLRPGWRKIAIEDGRLETGVRWIDR